MNEPLMDAAYRIGREQLQAARRSAFSRLGAEFPKEAFDPVHRAAERGMKFYLAALSLAEKTWAGSLSAERAQQALREQFPDFPVATCERAFYDAYSEAR